MELRELRVFVAVVEEGGFSPAARRLHLSQPALSQIIGSLERRLGVRLLVRSSTGAQPTDAGRALLTEARELITRHDQAVAAMARFGGKSSTVLRVGIPLELPSSLLTEPVGVVATKFTGTEVRALHLSTSAQFAALRADELDVGLVREHPLGQDLDAIPVVMEPLGVLIGSDAAAHLAGPEGVRLDALTGQRHLVLVDRPPDHPPYLGGMAGGLPAVGCRRLRRCTRRCGAAVGLMAASTSGCVTQNGPSGYNCR